MDPLARWAPDADAMLALCRENVDARVLDAISGSDYSWEPRKHRAALDTLLAKAPLWEPCDWYPREVLSLVRFLEADDGSPESKQWGGASALGLSERHWARALACALLLRASGEDFENQSVAALVDSAMRLGPRAERAAGQLLAWRLAEHPGEEEPFFWFALAILALRAASDPEWIDALCARAVAAEREALISPEGSGRWLLRSSLFSAGRWQRFAHHAWHLAHPRPDLFEIRALCEQICPDLAATRDQFGGLGT